jgi:hypothetical protein
MLTLAGMACLGTDTPESLRLWEQAKTKSPGFPWPALNLARVYSEGKRVDKQRSLENLMAFYSACPACTDWRAQSALRKVGTPELQSRVAAALRAKLSKESSPRRLREFESLWGLESRARPPQEHEV